MAQRTITIKLGEDNNEPISIDHVDKVKFENICEYEITLTTPPEMSPKPPRNIDPGETVTRNGYRFKGGGGPTLTYGWDNVDSPKLVPRNGTIRVT